MVRLKVNFSLKSGPYRHRKDGKLHEAVEKIKKNPKEYNSIGSMPGTLYIVCNLSDLLEPRTPMNTNICPA